QLVIVVLSGVDQQLGMLRAQQARDRRRLDELRTVPDDRDDVHRDVRIRSATPSEAARLSGPGAGSSSSPMRWTGCTSRRVEAMKASLMAGRSSGVVMRSCAPVTAMT